LKLPAEGPDEIPAFIMTTTGPFVVEDLANKQLRTAQVGAQMAGLAMAATPQDDKGAASSSHVDDGPGGEKNASESSPPQPESDDKEVTRAARADLRKWRDLALARQRAGKSQRAFVSDVLPESFTRSFASTVARCQTSDELRALFASALDSQIIRAAPPIPGMAEERPGHSRALSNLP